MIYIIYVTVITISVIIYHLDSIYMKLKPLFIKGKRAIRNPRVTRDISLAVMVNSLFSLINSSSILGVFGYLMLTLAGVVGIIISNDKIND